MKIVADNTVPFLKGIAEPIAEVKYLTSKEFTPENVQDADILIVRSIDKCTRELLEGSRVKLITSATIGFDHIDTRYCDKAGITWKNSPGCNAVSVAQYVLSGLVTSVAAARNLVVVHTPSGAAQYVASVIDKQPIDGVLGTIAGDDTVMVICADDDYAKQRAQWLLDVVSKG